MQFSTIYKSGQTAVSFELFPPKKWRGVTELFSHFNDLAACGPSFITCTYGAGGASERTTLEILSLIKGDFPHIPQASHLTCVSASVDHVRDYLRRAQANGVDFIVALRGDAPRDAKDKGLRPDGLRHANELVELIAREFPDFGIAVAGYPETHPEAVSPESDIEFLKGKVDAGAQIIITQLFFDNGDFFRFRDRCVKAGITVPIVPGVLPVTNLAQVKRITAMCGSKTPERLFSRLEACQGDMESQFAVGLYYATHQTEELVDEGVAGVHFYVLNQGRATTLICRALNLVRRPESPQSPIDSAREGGNSAGAVAMMI